MSPCWALSLFGSVVSTHRSKAAAEAQRERLVRRSWHQSLQINIYPCETPEEALSARREVARNRR